MGTTLFLDSNQIHSETQFHDEIERQLMPPVYGRNLDALWEVLTEMVETPIHITWINVGASNKFLGDRFKKYVKVFEDAQGEFPTGDYTLVFKI